MSLFNDNCIFDRMVVSWQTFAMPKSDLTNKITFRVYIVVTKYIFLKLISICKSASESNPGHQYLFELKIDTPYLVLLSHCINHIVLLGSYNLHFGASPKPFGHKMATIR